MTMSFQDYPMYGWRFNHTLAALRALTAGVSVTGAQHLPLLRC